MLFTTKTLTLALGSLAMALTLGAMPANAADDVLSIQGELTYLQRIAVPDESIAIVEIKAADAAPEASVLAEVRIPMEGRQVPVKFGLEINHSAFTEGTDYVLRGGIFDGQSLAWLSDPVAIDTSATELNVGTLMLAQFTAPSPVGIGGVEWTVEDIAGGGIIDSSYVTMTFEDGSVSGAASCNRYFAGYVLDGDKLTISDAGATMMMCEEAQMNQEQKFFAALESVKTFAISDDGALVLSDANGPVITARVH